MLKRDIHGRRLQYTEVVDWWSLGCIIFEMRHGKSPFRTTAAKNLIPGDKVRIV